MTKAVWSARMFLLASLGLGMGLISCASPEKIGGDTATATSAYLEDLGGGVCRQHPQGLMWQAGKSPMFKSWEEADQYVQSLDLGGYTDWRLPTPDECLSLSKLIQLKKGDCTIEGGGNHWVSKTKNIEAGQWESSIYCDGPIFRWTKDKQGTVKAVRP